MQRQALGQQSLMGIDVDDFDSTFPETTRRYQEPHYNEVDATPDAKLSAPITRNCKKRQLFKLSLLSSSEH